MTPGAAALTFACPTCKAAAKARCVTASGKETTPHIQRWRLGEGFVSGVSSCDAKIAELTQARDQADQLLSAANDGLRTMTTERDRLKVEAQALHLEISGLTDQVDTLTRDLAVTKAEYAAYVKAHPDEPEPTESVTKFGACPEKPGGTSLAAQAGVVTKWGKGAAVRQFFGGISQVAPRHPDAGIVHASWKEYNRANLTPAKVKAAVANLKAGDVVEVGHESDNDGLTAAQQTERIAIKNLFHDIVKEVRPDLLVSLTLVGYSFDPKSGKVPALEGWVKAVKADVLGIDCDGVRPTKLPYTDFTAETKTVLDFLTKYPSYKWFAVPEFGCPRIPGEDPDGTVRAAYHDKYAAMWGDTGKCLFVTLYEYDSSPNYSLTTPAEITGWTAHVKEN